MMYDLDLTEALAQGIKGDDRPEYKDPWAYFGDKAPAWARAAWWGDSYYNSGTNIIVPAAPEGSVRTKSGVIIPASMRGEDNSLLVPGTVPLSADGHEIAGIGGKGSGKTFVFTMRDVRLVQRFPGSKGMIVANSYAQAYGSAGVKLAEICKAMDLEFIHRTEMVLDGVKHYNVYYFPGFDSVVCVLSFENIKMIEGTEWDWAHFEEMQDCDIKAIEVAVSRVRRGKADSSIVYAGMPDDVNHDMYAYFDANDIPLYEPPLAENAHNLPPDYTKRMKRLHGDDYDRYVLGKRISLFNTPALRQFRWDVHVRSDDNPEIPSLGYLCDYDPSKQIYITFDFNVNPLCVSIWQEKTHPFEVKGADTHLCPVCSENLVWSHLLQGWGCKTHGKIPNPQPVKRGGIVHKELLVQVDEFELFGGTTMAMCNLILADYGHHTSGGMVLGDATGNKGQTSVTEPGQTDWSIIKRMLGKLPGMVVREGVIRHRKPSNQKMQRGEKRITYTNPPVRERITVFNSFLMDEDGHPRIIFLPESKYPSGGAAKSCATVRWGGDGKVDSKNDKLDPSVRNVPRTHYFDGTGYVVFFKAKGKVVEKERNAPRGTSVERARLAKRMRFGG